MSTLSFKVLDLDFPAGSKNKTATLVTGETEALLVDAGFTRADGHRLAAEILDSGKTADDRLRQPRRPRLLLRRRGDRRRLPRREFVATPLVIEHIKHSYEGKLKAWAALGANLPTRLVDLDPARPATSPSKATASSSRAARRACPTATTCGRPSTAPSSAASCSSSRSTSGSPTPPRPTTAPPGSSCWTRWPPSTRSWSSPATACPDTAADASAITATRDYLVAFEEELGKAADGAALTEALVKRYPDNGMLIAAQIGAKVAKGEMKWG